MSLINHMLNNLERRRAEMPVVGISVLPMPMVESRWLNWRVGGWFMAISMAVALTGMIWYDRLVRERGEVVRPPEVSFPAMGLSPAIRVEEPEVRLQESRHLTVVKEEEVKVVQAPPDSGETDQVDHLLRKGNRRQAEKILRHKVKINGSDQPSRLVLARTLWEGKRHQEAIRLLTDALPTAKDSEIARLLAHFYLDLGQSESAVEVLEEVARKLGWNQQLRVEQDGELAAFLAALYQEQGDHRRAIHWYGALLSRDGRISRHWLGLAISLEAMQSNTEAWRAYGHAMEKGDLPVELMDYTRLRLAALVSFR